MNNIKLIKPKEQYIRSYWETFDTIAKERKNLASNEPFPYDETVDFIKMAIEQDLPHLFIIDIEKDICIGWCDASPKTETVGYLGMGLLREYRERGIGRKALEQVIDMSVKYGFTTIELDVLKSNSRAIHLYETVGFKQTNLVVGGFTFHSSFVSEDVVQMSLDLTVI